MVGNTAMRRHILRLGAFLLVFSLAGGASAATLAGVTLPDSYPVEGRTLKLNGIGLRTLSFVGIGVRIYVAGLYVSEPSHDARAILASPGPKVMLLQFLHAGTKAEVEKEYREGERQNCGDGGCPAADQPDFERLVAAAPAVKFGDTTTYIFTPSGVRVLANNQPVVDLANKDLSYRLLAGFIGVRPPSQELKNGLLGVPGN